MDSKFDENGMIRLWVASMESWQILYNFVISYFFENGMTPSISLLLSY